jgi:serine/threonine protein kinase
MSTRPCPNIDSLQSLAEGSLPPEESVSCLEHVEQCAPCQHSLDRFAQAATMVSRETLVQHSANPESEVVQDLIGRLQGMRMAVGNDETIQSPNAPGAAADVAWDFLAPPQAADEIGRLANYRILGVLGQGGMGVVFRAEDIDLNRTVAIKAMLPALVASGSAKKRFLREARTAASIKHDNVVSIYQVSEDRGVPFLAMEYLNGHSLEAHLASRGKLSPAEAVAIGRQIAEGLDSAHRIGLIHRDIKPANIWLETRGAGFRAKILDFGLARHTEDQGLTQQGSIMGTPSYMAPEQAQGGDVDCRADLFSLGVILYQSVTGAKPFQGRDMVSTLVAISTERARPVRETCPECPPALAGLIDDLLSKSAAERPSAEEVSQRLERIQNEDPATPAPAPTRTAPARGGSKRILLIASAFAFLGLVVLAAVGIFQFTTKDGTLIVEVDDEADVRFRKGKLELYDDKGTLKYSIEPSERNKALPPGKYLVKVVGADGVKLETEAFEMERKGKAFLRVTSSGPSPLASRDHGPTPALVPVDGGKPGKEVLPGKADLGPLDPAWTKAVASLPADKQGEAVRMELKRRNPMYTGEFRCDHSRGRLESCDFDSSTVADLRPLAALPGLKKLEMRDSTPHGERKLPPLDIAPLAGLPLVFLDLSGTQVADLSPLKGMPLEILRAHFTKVKDLTPLKGMPLTELGIGATAVTDLSPLAGMKLVVFGAHPYTPVTDVSPLAGMPLESLHIGRIQDAAPLRGMPIKDLTVGCRLYSEADEAVYRSLPLQRWNDKPAAEVWKEVEAARKADDEAAARLRNVPVKKEALEKALREECRAASAGVTIADGAVVGIVFEAGAPNQLGKLRAFPKLKTLTVVPNSDMSPLLGMPIEEIDCIPSDLEYNRPILKAMPKLKTINGQPAKQVLGSKSD